MDFCRKRQRKEKMMRVFFYIFILLLLVQSPGFSSYLDQANEFLNNNQPEQALPLLEKALIEDPTNPGIYINLGFTYEQLGNKDKALETYKKGIPHAGDIADKLYYNIGQIYYVMDRNSIAVEMYSKSIDSNPRFAKPYLGRVLAALKLTRKLDDIEKRIQAYESIIKDCETFLVLDPTNSQREQIEELIARLRKGIRDKEQREKDLENLLDLLNNSTDSTKDITAGAEDIDVEYEDEDILD
jgi:tetratricopeptide (TPR) repeat protein